MIQGGLCMCTELQGRASSGQWTREQLQLKVKEKPVTQQGLTQMYKLSMTLFHAELGKGKCQHSNREKTAGNKMWDGTIQKGASKEKAFEEGPQGNMHRQQGEERAESGHPKHTARMHKSTIPNDAETEHKLSATINNCPRCMLDFWLVWAWLVAMVDWWRLNNVLQTCLHYFWSPVNYLYSILLKENKHRCVYLYFCRLPVHKGNLLYFCLSKFLMNN